MSIKPNFFEYIHTNWKKSLLCIGLDPEMNKIPEYLRQHKNAFYLFCKEIIDATADLVCAYKPQFAYFAAQRAEAELEKIIAYIHTQYPHIPVILDVKRGDIGSTAKQYAVEAFDRYQADAVTLNPYMGWDSIQPFIEYTDKGIFILCRTSNAYADAIQNLKVCSNTDDMHISEQPLYLKIAQLATTWNIHNNIGLVAGATYPNELASIRKIVADMPFLVPGIGAQGGDILATLAAGGIQTQDTASSLPNGLILSSSRAILYAGADENFALAARKVAQDTCTQIMHAAHSV
jgi:orotidine-5'-phosphate decarboxylase